MEFLIIVFLIGLSLFIYMLKEAHINKVKLHTITTEHLPASFGEVKIFFISDIHRRKISEKITEAIKGKTDFIIIGGDLTEKGVSFDKVKENVRMLRNIAPVYFVWGNNDYETDYHELDAVLLENKVKILDNTAVSFESPSGDKLWLLGVDDVGAKRDRLDFALADASEGGGFKILASHNPKIIEKILPEHDIHLVLSGHTHGGQIRLFGFGLYPKGKMYTQAKTNILISNGYGTTALPLRLGARAETHHITVSHRENL